MLFAFIIFLIKICTLVFFWRFQGQEGVRCALCTNAPYATVMIVFLSIGHVHIQFVYNAILSLLW
jgi:hypothetical protein